LNGIPSKSPAAIETTKKARNGLIFPQEINKIRPAMQKKMMMNDMR
jgi:hypothetical protein